MKNITKTSNRCTARPAGRGAAFTLIELLVVIAIISVLITILVPSLNAVKEASRTVACAFNLQNIGVSMAMYQADSNRKLPVAEIGELETWHGGWLVRGLWGSSLSKTPLFVAWEEGYFPTGEVFYCPLDADNTFDRWWHRPDRYRTDLDDALRSGYESRRRGIAKLAYGTEVFQWGGMSVAPPPPLYTARCALASDTFAFSGGHEPINPRTHDDGYNVVYTDGTVEFYSDVEGFIPGLDLTWYMADSVICNIVWPEFDPN